MDNWVEEQSAKLVEKLQANHTKSLKEFAQEMIEFLAQQTNASQGILYICQTERKKVKAVAGYATVAQQRFNYGEGLVGQAIVSKQSICFNHLPTKPSGHIRSLTELKPSAAMILPLLFNDVVSGVAELLFLVPYKPYHQEFLELAAGNLGASLQNVLANHKVNDLLQKSQKANQVVLKAQERMSRQQLELKALLAENRSITDGLNRSMLVSITDLKGEIVKVNHIFCEVSGYTEAELLGQDHHILNSGFHSRKFWTQMWMDIRAGRMWRADVKNKAKDGAFYWVDTVINPMFDEKGEIYRFLSMRNLITNRKLVEEEIKQKNAELHQNHEKMTTQKDLLEAANAELHNYRSRIEQSIRAALLIQNAILPSSKTLKQYFTDYFIIYRPRDLVSGDFYWLGQTSQKTVLVVADCTGHGIPGAFMTMIGKSLLDQIVKIACVTEPDQILTLLNQDVQQSLEQERTGNDNGMDAVVVVLEGQNGKVNVGFSGAKNGMYYLEVGSQTLQEIKGSRKSIGGMKNQKTHFKAHHFQLPMGSLLYLGTDGITDQQNIQRKRFGKNQLKQLLQESIHLSLNEQKNRLETALNRHQKGTKQRDDILWMGIKL